MEGRFEIYAGSRRLRRFYAWFLAFLVVYTLVTAVWGSGWNVVTGAVLLVGQVPLYLLHLRRVIIDTTGVTADDRWRERHVAWHDIDLVRLRWYRRDGDQPLLQVVRKDGEEVPLWPLANLADRARREERARLLARLHHEAAAHDFGLEVTEPRRPSP